MVADAKVRNTHLLIYAPTVARKMIRFNGSNYYTIPNLPDDWEAPRWLKIGVGLLAGRLFFEFEEFDELLHYLGIDLNNASREAEEHHRLLNAPGLGKPEPADQQNDTSKPVAATVDKSDGKVRKSGFSKKPARLPP